MGRKQRKVLQRMIEFVTSMGSTYFSKYGKKMIESFLEFTDLQKLSIYHEDELSYNAVPGMKSGRIDLHHLSNISGFSEYMIDAKKEVSKKIGNVSSDPDNRVGYGQYDYRWDALTFGKKGFSFFTAARESKARLLFWADADIIFYRLLSEKILDGLFIDKSNKRRSVVHFGRQTPHTETGFFGVDLSSIDGNQFVEAYASFWEERKVFEIKEGWTDCHVFDKALELSGVQTTNLSTIPEGHVIAASPLSYYFDHLKGAKRKKLGISPERKA